MIAGAKANLASYELGPHLYKINYKFVRQVMNDTQEKLKKEASELNKKIQ